MTFAHLALKKQNRTGDSFTQGAYTVIKAIGGKIQLREVVGGSTILVHLDRIDQRVNDPRSHITGDDRRTLLAVIAANKLQSDTTNASLRAEISALRDQQHSTDKRAVLQVSAFCRVFHISFLP